MELNNEIRNEHILNALNIIIGRETTTLSYFSMELLRNAKIKRKELSKGDVYHLGYDIFPIQNVNPPDIITYLVHHDHISITPSIHHEGHKHIHVNKSGSELYIDLMTSNQSVEYKNYKINVRSTLKSIDRPQIHDIRIARYFYLNWSVDDVKNYYLLWNAHSQMSGDYLKEQLKTNGISADMLKGKYIFTYVPKLYMDNRDFLDQEFELTISNKHLNDVTLASCKPYRNQYYWLGHFDDHTGKGYRMFMLFNENTLKPFTLSYTWKSREITIKHEIHIKFIVEPNSGNFFSLNQNTLYPVERKSDFTPLDNIVTNPFLSHGKSTRDFKLSYENDICCIKENVTLFSMHPEMISCLDDPKFDDYSAINFRNYSIEHQHNHPEHAKAIWKL